MRLLSLDIFRGMTVFFMIIVNTPGTWGAVYAPLLHADWHGFSPTDLVFPSFLFAVGASVGIVLPRMAEKFTPQQVYRKIIKRALLIFVIGFIIYKFPFVKWQADGSLAFIDLSTTRIMGVLQRIGLAYGLAVAILYAFSLRKAIWITTGILITYWMILFGFGDYSLEGNIGLWLDKQILGADHLYGGEGIPFDPEGLLSTLPCIGNIVAGYATVYYMCQKNANYETLFRLALVGAGLIAAACMWHYAFPINKKLWTSSYVLLTSGIGMLMLVGLHYLLDKKRKGRAWAQFFAPMGKNPLAIYALSVFLVRILLFVRTGEGTNLYGSTYETVFRPMGDHLGSFLFALVFTMICWAVAWWLDKQKVYLRV
ncbi:MAG: acyltransferase family protein [Saprospiraceae bacterium]